MSSHPIEHSTNSPDAGGKTLAVNAKQAAAMLGISPRTLWQLTNSSRIPHIRLGRRILYRPDALRAWLERSEKGGRR